MNNWNTISANFTNEEVKEIEKFKKKYGYKTNNGLLRKAVEELFQISFPDFPKIPVGIHQVFTFSDDYTKRLDRLEKEEFEKFTREWVRNYWNKEAKKHLLKLKEVNDAWESFRFHKKRGAPKTKPGKRGRPSKKEISK